MRPARTRRSRARARWSHAALLVAVGCAAALLPACKPLLPARVSPIITATAEPARFVAGSPLTVTFVVSADRPDAPVPTGQLFIATFNATVPLVDGRFTWSGTFNPSGTFTIGFDYSGDDRYLPGSGSVQFTADLGMVPFRGTGPTVAMAGDSITFLSKPFIEDRLSAAGYRRSVTGVFGYTSGLAQWIIDAYAAEHPDVLIYDLGTNDLSALATGQGVTLEDLEARVLAAAAQLPGSCFVVSTLSAHRTEAWEPSYQAYNDAAVAYNDWVRATFPHVLDWEAAVAASIAAGTPILPDEVHPGQAGQAVLGELATQAADRCLGRVAETP